MLWNVDRKIKNNSIQKKDAKNSLPRRQIRIGNKKAKCEVVGDQVRRELYGMMG